MIKHIKKDMQVTFSEVPDEITLCFNISNCQNACVGCHSPYLLKNIGEELTNEKIDEYIKKNEGITCVCFMGEGNDMDALLNAVKHVRASHQGLKTAIYSGRDEVEPIYKELFDYVKTGHYDAEYGPLISERTNQRMTKYTRLENGEILSENITYKFLLKRLGLK